MRHYCPPTLNWSPSSCPVNLPHWAFLTYNSPPHPIILGVLALLHPHLHPPSVTIGPQISFWNFLRPRPKNIFLQEQANRWVDVHAAAACRRLRGVGPSTSWGGGGCRRQAAILFFLSSSPLSSLSLGCLVLSRCALGTFSSSVFNHQLF